MTPFDVVNEFKTFMLEYGIETNDRIIPDGMWHRAHAIGHKPGSKNVSYRLYADGIKPAGFLEDFKTGIKLKWKASAEASPITPEQRQQLLDTRQQREAQDEKQYLQAAATAQHMLNIAKPVTGNDHPYLKQKRVNSHGLYRLKTWQKRIKTDNDQWEALNIHNVLLVPLIDINGQLWSVQAIFPEENAQLKRNKDFLPRGRQGGLFHVIGDPDDEIIICEGYATGASLYQETGIQTLCAMSAGNLMSVARAVRTADPGKKIIMAADNDTKTPGNPGLTAAKKAALAVSARLAVPPCPGDFNDFNNMGFYK